MITSIAATSSSSSPSGSSPSESISLRSQPPNTPTSGRSSGRGSRTRTIMTPFQARILKRVLETTAFPTSDLRDNLAKILGMKARTIQIWFQNQRQKTRQRQKSREQQQPGSNVPSVASQAFPQVDLKWSRFHGAFHNLSPGLHPCSVASGEVSPMISNCPSTHALHPIPGYRFRYHPYQPPGVTTPVSPSPAQQQPPLMPSVMRMPVITEQHLLSEIKQEVQQHQAVMPLNPELAPLREPFSPIKRVALSPMKQTQIRLVHRAPLDALCEAAVASLPEPDEWDGAMSLLKAQKSPVCQSIRPW